jgi:dynein heavy chain
MMPPQLLTWQWQCFHAVLCRFHITPKLYLDLLQQYSTLLAARKSELGDNRRRLLNGIDKLDEANTALDAMQVTQQSGK